MFGCATKPVYRSIEGFAQGTTYHITYEDNGVGDLMPQVDDLLARFDTVLSNYNDSSMLSRVNRGEDIALNEWFITCFNESVAVNAASDGLFDPSLRPLINAYGFGAKGRKDFRILSDDQLKSVLENVGLNKIKIEGDRLIMPDSMSLDFSAIAQGYSVDLVCQMLDSMDVKNYMVEVGGELYCKGVNSKGGFWRVGIDMPEEGNFVSGEFVQEVVELQDKGLATSGNYRKYFEVEGVKYSHSINPKSGLCSRDSLLSVTIVASTAALADGYATCCMVGGYAWGVDFVKRMNLTAYLIYSDYKGDMITTKINN